jgi:hypothetical protein
MLYVALSNTVSNHVLTLTKSILGNVASLNTKVSAMLFSTLALFLEVRGSNLLSETKCSEFFFLFPHFHRQIWRCIDSIYSYIFCLFLLSMLRMHAAVNLVPPLSPILSYCGALLSTETTLSYKYPCANITISKKHWHTHSYIVKSPPY